MKKQILLMPAAAADMARDGSIDSTAQAIRFEAGMGASMTNLMTALGTVGEFTGADDCNYAFTDSNILLVIDPAKIAELEERMKVKGYSHAIIGEFDSDGGLFATTAAKVLSASDNYYGVLAGTAKELTTTVLVIYGKKDPIDIEMSTAIAKDLEEIGANILFGFTVDQSQRWAKERLTVAGYAQAKALGESAIIKHLGGIVIAPMAAYSYLADQLMDNGYTHEARIIGEPVLTVKAKFGSVFPMALKTVHLGEVLEMGASWIDMDASIGGGGNAHAIATMFSQRRHQLANACGC